jgi:murein L,D-transpeptidase YcbB/YkuD
LAEAVRQFQHDHGIDVDGVVGKQSFDFLNMSHQKRVDSLRVNMDRLRWIARDVSDDYVVVNIAGFELYYIRNHDLVWETPVMTGTVRHQTPVFTKRLKYLEFNPTWTVPRSIIGRSLLPKFRANPQYVLDNDYVLYDRQGQAVDPHSIDWQAYNISNFPYRVGQQPGEKNALGRVKFIFPNEYAIYLHDTPSRALFYRNARAFSSGCVRVKNPLKFAEMLLDDPEEWPLDQVEALVASREPQQRVFMERDVDIMLMYWTTSPTSGGQLQFHSDVYGKDLAALADLDAPQVVLDVAQQ